MLGSVLSNLLLVLGMAFWAAGKNFKEAKFRVTAAQTNGSILTLGAATLIIREESDLVLAPAVVQNPSSTVADWTTALRCPDRFSAAAYHASTTGRSVPRNLTAKDLAMAVADSGLIDEDIPGSDGDLKGLLVISRLTAIVS